MDTNQPAETTNTGPETETKPGTTENDKMLSTPREHVWKGPDGTQKNIPLPIETIHEENELDPDNMTNLNPIQDKASNAAQTMTKMQSNKSFPKSKNDKMRATMQGSPDEQTDEITSGPAILQSESKASIKTQNEKSIDGRESA